MPVTGVGGLFVRSRDTKALAEWYQRHLGLGYGWRQEAGPTVFAPFDEASDYFAADRRWMLNLRVSDLDGLLDELRAAGVEVVTKAEWGHRRDRPLRPHPRPGRQSDRALAASRGLRPAAQPGGPCPVGRRHRKGDRHA